MSRNRTVLRHRIPVDDQDHTFAVCCSARAIYIGAKFGDVNVWVEQWEPASTETIERTFRVFGTGQPIPPGYHYKGTVVVEPYVWHVYERAEHPRD